MKIFGLLLFNQKQRLDSGYALDRLPKTEKQAFLDARRQLN